MQRYPVKLSSDALSGFGLLDRNIHNAEISGKIDQNCKMFQSKAF
jgi:hypothetical protein